MASLYEITGEYMDLVEAFDNAETEEEKEAIFRAVADLDGELKDKADVYAKLVRNRESDAAGYKAEIERLTAKKRAAENFVTRLKEMLLETMKLLGQTEIQTSIGRWKTQLNPVSCEVVDASEVPEEYRIKQEDKIDRKGLIEHFKQTGEVMPGVEMKQETGIRFR